MNVDLVSDQGKKCLALECAEDPKLLVNTYSIQKRWNSRLRIEKGLERIAKSAVAAKGCIERHSQHRSFDTEVDRFVSRPFGSRAANLASISTYGYPRPYTGNPALLW